MTVLTELRRLVVARADRRCEYCLLHELDGSHSHECDHICSMKHGGLTTAENLAYACFLCNRYKGSDIGSVGIDGTFVAFFNPRTNLWQAHFTLRGPVIVPLTETGRVTARLLRFNAADRIEIRSDLQARGRYPTANTRVS